MIVITSSAMVYAYVSTPHLRVLVKTHKPGCPVRLTFSSIGTVTRNLSTFLDVKYLKPSIQAFSPRRLLDTKAAALFIEDVNKNIWENNKQQKPIVYALDVVNFFPSVLESLALPAVSDALRLMGIRGKEIEAVLEGLKVVRGGSFFKWRDEFWQQISGCALGDVDSCSYTDLAMSHLLSIMIPRAEIALSTSMDLFRAYRDDRLGITFDSPETVLSIQQYFNQFQ